MFAVLSPIVVTVDVVSLAFGRLLIYLVCISSLGLLAAVSLFGIWLASTLLQLMLLLLFCPRHCAIPMRQILNDKLSA